MMNTRRFATMLFSAYAVLFASREAQAFYNPSAGRWLSRDPIEEKGGVNVYGFAGNDMLSRADVLGRDIIVHCPQKYFEEHGIHEYMYSSDGDHHSALPGALPPSNLSGDIITEILWKMLQDERQFTAAAHSVAQLKRHVSARTKVIKATEAVKWGPSPDGDSHEVFNPVYWDNPMVLKSGVDPIRAVNDPFMSPENYYTGCRWGSMLVLLKGTADESPGELRAASNGNSHILSLDQRALIAQFIRFKQLSPGGRYPTLDNWVPGDRGFVKNSVGRGFFAGEWLIYLGGGDRFWGFGWDKKDSVRSIQSWVDEMGQREGEVGYRYWPGVGLEK